MNVQAYVRPRTRLLVKEDVISAIMRWPGLYEAESGERFQGMPVSQVPKQLIDCGWRNVSRFDKHDFRDMGLEIVGRTLRRWCKAKAFLRCCRSSEGQIMTNEESSITYNEKGVAVCFAGCDAVEVFRAASLASAIGLLSKGIRPGRGWTMTKALAMAKQYTGRAYKRTEHEQARKDLNVWVQTMKSALPSEVR